ncbi:hypothetical protein NA56DRAFT_711027 [Hyaloscypha hepaticicola]|uniref:F-box domain-containing protein n=1 Tax=Hyaloscypha hepaticicola TaxID=2082293 RepID=A0A2J6PKA3_9HELO|nr:hypothetical protein NA56DRAFT_711027 [Hyaloscypha hepaticicola]
MNLPISLLKLLMPRIRHPTTKSRELAREITTEEATPATMSTRSHLLALPPELHLEIFKHLRPVSSTCLGLTCKEFYRIHKQLHGMVGLHEPIIICQPRRYPSWRFTRLGALLTKWAGPKFYFHR